MNVPETSLNPIANISDLSIAETKMILKPTWSLREVLLKYTIMDLLLRQVIDLKEEVLIRRDGTRNVYLFFRQGAQFNNTDLNPHETIITKHLKNPKDRFLIRVFMKMIYKDTKEMGTIKGLVAQTLKSKGLLSKMNLFEFASGYSLSYKGKMLQKEITSTLSYMEQNMERLADDEEKMTEALSRLGTNFVLIDKLDFKLSEKLSKTIKGFERSKLLNYSIYDTLWTYDTLMDFGIDFNSFDSSFGGGLGGDFGSDFGDFGGDY